MDLNKKRANAYPFFIESSPVVPELHLAYSAISSCVMAMLWGFVPPEDGPQPLTPQQAIASFRLPSGFRIELVAAEPLIREPTGVCWDQRGRLYVSELHGYNLEGELEIEALNKTGVVDTVVRRVQAAEPYKQAARSGTYGTIKRLTDTNGDGQMDKVEVLADHLPPAYGLCAARGGLIVAGQDQIVYLADRNDDGIAEVVDTLFTGFQGGALERGINAPQWGPDGWIYFGRGWNGGQITGLHLAKPVPLPGANFRIRADGSAIEPITGSTHTIGHAFTPDGDSFFTNTWKHALYAIPIPWPYLMRNPDAAIASLEADASDYSTVYPLAPTHPWKLARSNQPGWQQLYDQYGLAESAASGYFTSSCSPIIYQDKLFPAEFSGNMFVCEPAQCLVHRCLVSQEGTGLRVRRAATEQKSEFLASTDSWFRPVSLAQGPDGSLYLTDMYREIIEDYSAVPRFMQQKYGLNNGVNRGRIWRISPVDAKPLAALSAIDMTKANLDSELASPHYWRRQTAERLLYEQQGVNASALAKRRLKLTDLRAETPPREFIRTLRSQDTLLIRDVATARRLSGLSDRITNERMLLQLALSVGYSQDATVFAALTEMARKHARIRWMPDAIMTGMNQRAGIMLAALLEKPGATGNVLLEPLAASVSARRNESELTTVLTGLTRNASTTRQAAVLTGLSQNMKPIPLADAGKQALNTLLKSSNLAVRGQAVALAGKLNLGDSDALNTLRRQAATDAANATLPTDQRLAAVGLLTNAADSVAGPALVRAWSTATPPVRAALLDALIGRGRRLPFLLTALTGLVIPVNTLSPLQRIQLLERADSHLRPRLEAEFAKATDPDKEAIYARYVVALNKPTNAKHGSLLFGQLCTPCHRVNQVGVAVGPDLKNAYANARETLLRSILWPSEKIASSYELYSVTTSDNETYTGVLAGELAGSVVLRQAGGTEQTFLRKDIKSFTSSPTSLMPEYGQALSPQDCADVIAWIKQSLSTRQ